MWFGGKIRGKNGSELHINKTWVEKKDGANIMQISISIWIFIIILALLVSLDFHRASNQEKCPNMEEEGTVGISGWLFPKHLAPGLY